MYTNNYRYRCRNQIAALRTWLTSSYPKFRVFWGLYSSPHTTSLPPVKIMRMEKKKKKKDKIVPCIPRNAPDSTERDFPFVRNSKYVGWHDYPNRIGIYCEVYVIDRNTASIDVDGLDYLRRGGGRVEWGARGLLVMQVISGSRAAVFFLSRVVIPCTVQQRRRPTSVLHANLRAKPVE